MKKYLSALAAVALLAPVLLAEPTITAATIVNRVAVVDDTISWDIFKLGMKLGDLQTLLEKEVPLNPGSEGDPTINRYAADLTHRGIQVHVAFESDDESAKLVYIRAAFPDGKPSDAPALTSALKARVPALVPADGSAALLLEGSDYQALILDNGIQLGAVWLF